MFKTSNEEEGERERASINLTAAPEEINYAHAALAGQTVRPETPLRHGQCVLKEKS